MSYPIILNQRNVVGNGRKFLHEASANRHISLVKFLLNFKTAILIKYHRLTRILYFTLMSCQVTGILFFPDLLLEMV